MSVWLLSGEADLNPEERGWIALPFGELPDLSAVHSLAQCRALLQSLSPEDPPETLATKATRLWDRLSAIQQENLVALPLAEAQEVAVAEITGPYRYEPAAEPALRHRCDVTWHNPVPFRKFRGYREVTQVQSRADFSEVTDVGLRNIIRSRLDVPYNRFSGLAWIAGLLFALQVLNMLIRLVRGG